MNNETKNVLFAMPNSQVLGKKIAQKINLPLCELKKVEFADGEVLFSAQSTVRNRNVFVVASTSKPVNNNLMELLIVIDSLKRASANTITIILSYYGYARQDRKADGRQPITAKLVADLLEKAGATKIISVDLHNPSIQGFFDVPVDDLKGHYIFASEIKALGQCVIVSPDHGGAVRARKLSDLIYKTNNIAIIDKMRFAANQTESMGVLGQVGGENVVIIDDIIDTGGTIINAAKTLKKEGAKKVVIVATHGLFSKGFEAFENAEYVDQVIVSDSVENVYNIKSNKLKIISLDHILAQAINSTINSTSISDFYISIKNELGNN